MPIITLMHKFAKTWPLIAMTLIACAGLLWLANGGGEQSWLYEHFDANALAQYIAAQGYWGLLSLALAGTLVAAIGVPRQLVSMVAGLSLTFWPALALATLTTALGALLTFTLSRQLAKPLVLKRLPAAVQKLETISRHQPFLKIIVIRFLPLGTNMITNLAAGTTTIPTWLFFFATVVGFVPQNTLFVLIGNGVQVSEKNQWLLVVSLTLVALLLCWRLYKQHLRNR